MLYSFDYFARHYVIKNLYILCIFIDFFFLYEIRLHNTSIHTHRHTQPFLTVSFIFLSNTIRNGYTFLYWINLDPTNFRYNVALLITPLRTNVIKKKTPRSIYINHRAFNPYPSSSRFSRFLNSKWKSFQRPCSTSALHFSLDSFSLNSYSLSIAIYCSDRRTAALYVRAYSTPRRIINCMYAVRERGCFLESPVIGLTSRVNNGAGIFRGGFPFYPQAALRVSVARVVAFFIELHIRI